MPVMAAVRPPGEMVLAEWLFDEAGSACLILDETRIRNGRGAIVGWVRGNSAYLLHGQHVGWYEGGVISDNTNCALAFTRNRTAYLPGGPPLRTPPAIPVLPAAPENPSFATTPGKPGRGGWSRHDAGHYFDA